MDGETVRVYVTAAPEDGKANAAILEALAKKLRTPKRDLTMVRGETSREKTVRVEGLEFREALARLAT